MIRDEDLKSSIDYSEGQKKAAHRVLVELVNIFRDEELPGSAEKTSSKRFYAVKRGRKKSERDDSDLLELWTENPSADALLLNLEQFHMLERRCF